MRAQILGCALVLLCACKESEDLAQTVVWVDAEPAAREMMARIRVQAVGPMSNLEPTVETTDPDWPIKLVLAPKNGDASRSFTLHIEARNGDDARLMTIQFATGFVANQSRFVKLLIHEACVQAPANCNAGEACNVWSIEVEADELSRNAKSPHKVDAECKPGEMKPPTAAGSGGAGGMLQTAGTGPTAGTGGVAGSPEAGASGQSGACADGYVRKTTGCTDVDECAAGDPCAGHGRCQNIPGDYICQCDPGYQVQSGSCVSVENCQTDNGGCDTTCDDSTGVVVCSCKPDAWLMPDRKSCASFTAPKRIGGPWSTLPPQPRFAFDAEGNGLAVWVEGEWTQDSTTVVSLWTRRYVAGMGWAASPAKLAISAGGSPGVPQVAMSSMGRGVVVWQQEENSDGDIWAVRYSDQKFGQPVRIDQQDTGSAYDPLIALDSNGDGIAAWTQTDGTNSHIWVNRLAAGSWGDSEEIPTSKSGPNGNGNGQGNSGTASDESAFSPRLSLDAQGNASLVWTQSEFETMNAPQFSPWSARFDPNSSKWHAALLLDDSGAAGYPDSQLFETGNGVIVWPRMTDGRVSIRASSHGPTGEWRDSINIAMVESEITAVMPRVALSPAGHGAAIWTQYAAPGVQIWANQYDGESDHWVGAKQLSTVSTTSAPLPQLAIDPSGDGFGVWSEIQDTSREIKVERLQTDAGFIGNVTLHTDEVTPQISQVQIAIDAHGKAVVIWDGYSMGGYSVWASSFE
ncbi:MAG TPA: hypothetical protein VFG30_38695 [Polyangiales bacterium]|nr:hypothetical protein [Polyangiales bacterium]